MNISFSKSESQKGYLFVISIFAQVVDAFIKPNLYSTATTNTTSFSANTGSSTDLNKIKIDNNESFQLWFRKNRKVSLWFIFSQLLRRWLETNCIIMQCCSHSVRVTYYLLSNVTLLCCIKKNQKWSVIFVHPHMQLFLQPLITECYLWQSS